MKTKKAVLLLNLGSPDSTKVKDVRRYLRQFLMDGRVLDCPQILRWFIVNCLILPRRPQASAHAYRKIWQPGGSPLILTSRRLQELLQAEPALPVELAMRYGNPSTPEAVQKLRREGIQQLLIIPLYPHYAMSSYESAIVHLMDELRLQAPDIQTTLLQPFYREEDYLQALVQSAAPYLADPYDKLLFSFHGIPERHLRKSDPSHAHCLATSACCDTPHPAHATCYRHQCFQTVQGFVEKAGIPKDKYLVSFQSRLGRDPWLRPYTDHVLVQLAKQGVKRLRVICPAFVSDCLETLEEIAMTGRESFLEAGGEDFVQIPCLNDHPAWVNFLKDKIERW